MEEIEKRGLNNCDPFLLQTTPNKCLQIYLFKSVIFVAIKLMKFNPNSSSRNGTCRFDYMWAVEATLKGGELKIVNEKIWFEDYNVW